MSENETLYQIRRNADGTWHTDPVHDGVWRSEPCESPVPLPWCTPEQADELEKRIVALEAQLAQAKEVEGEILEGDATCGRPLPEQVSEMIDNLQEKFLPGVVTQIVCAWLASGRAE
jgi:hypothetical protein